MRFVAFLFLLAAASADSSAQSVINSVATGTPKITVYLTGYTSPSVCSFVASSIASSLQVDVPLNATTGSTGARPSFSPTTITKHVDECSGTLVHAALAGSPFSTVFAVVTPPERSSEPAYIVLMRLASVQNISSSATEHKELLESVSFQFGDYTIAEVNSAGRVGTCTGYNLASRAVDTSQCATIQTFVTNLNARTGG